MPYRCRTCTKTITEGSMSCGSCGTRFSLPVPSGEAPAGPFPQWPPNKNNGGAKSGLNLVNVVIGVSLVLGAIVACFFLSVGSQRPQQPPDGLDLQKQATYFTATKQLGDLITRQDPRVSHVNEASAAEPDTISVTVQGELTPYTSRKMAQYYYQRFTNLREGFFDHDRAAKGFVFVYDDTGKRVADASIVGVEN